MDEKIIQINELYKTAGNEACAGRDDYESTLQAFKGYVSDCMEVTMDIVHEKGTLFTCIVEQLIKLCRSAGVKIGDDIKPHNSAADFLSNSDWEEGVYRAFMFTDDGYTYMGCFTLEIEDDEEMSPSATIFLDRVGNNGAVVERYHDGRWKDIFTVPYPSITPYQKSCLTSTYAEGALTGIFLDSEGEHTDEALTEYLEGHRHFIDLAEKVKEFANIEETEDGEPVLTPKNPNIYGVCLRERNGFWELCQYVTEIPCAEHFGETKYRDYIRPVSIFESDSEAALYMSNHYDRNTYDETGFHNIILYAHDKGHVCLLRGTEGMTFSEVSSAIMRSAKTPAEKAIASEFLRNLISSEDCSELIDIPEYD